MNQYEVETKILDVDEPAIRQRLTELGAQLIQDTLLKVDWYRYPATSSEWFLRIRYSNQGLPEVTWKAAAVQMASARQVKEISFTTENAAEIAALFTGIGLERYAHQEKYRTSWTYDNWRFDLDRYPNVRPFLEIEGQSDQHVREAIQLLGLTNHQTYTDGERTLMEDIYHVNWYTMCFLH